MPEDETTDVGHVCDRDARESRGRARGTVPDVENSTECVESEGDVGPKIGDALASGVPSLEVLKMLDKLLCGRQAGMPGATAGIVRRKQDGRAFSGVDVMVGAQESCSVLRP